MNKLVSDHDYLWPKDLKVSPTPLRRVLFIGTCRDDNWANIARSAPEDPCEADFELFYHTRSLPPEPPQPVENYDFQVLFPPLRRVLPETSYFRLASNDFSTLEQLLLDCETRLDQFLDQMLAYNARSGLLSFVCNFIVPQQNPLGRLMPRYDLRNSVHFVERLNEILGRLVATRKNVFLLDVDSISAVFGRKYLQNDVVWACNDGGALTDADFAADSARLENATPVSQIYPTRVYDYLLYAWNEAVAMFRTVRQIDAVKLVILDLDDTMWRGIGAERTDGFFEAMEGWPIGFIEALNWLKKRGILLAIASKNEEDQVRRVWHHLAHDARLHLDDFAITRINWKPKAENIEEILATVNLLPRSVLFVDDNPAERAAVKAAFPDMRVMGSNPYLWRRILLWSSETQVPTITSESASRTEMVRGQVRREEVRRKLSRAEFLLTLNVRIELCEIKDDNHPKFNRSFELINKSNQFNTTGRRWTREEFQKFFEQAGSVFVFDVTDDFTAYGQVGCVLVRDDNISQFVMSCRVLGLDVEFAAIAHIASLLQGRGAETITAELIKTKDNRPAADLYERTGFSPDPDQAIWTCTISDAPKWPAHIKLVETTLLDA